ncbi:MAG: hypothetical protein LKH74_03905 [Levilactobacillus sp.]|uniref:hypothetical protein n=1 Tax=Levilactobacillus sp. TaxID=2767919 RepID=UPI002585AFFC|nr:hypothetical protein [Levilactobacillus sp.]MCI1553046.1 hypothetical protein [Levilactobacillus sp.]MCI1598187.1 hypothetical protein [Levilactobacillus sp.]MCI1605050.1 hypothetical protein [Levilactobacillus sp.]
MTDLHLFFCWACQHDIVIAPAEMLVHQLIKGIIFVMDMKKIVMAATLLSIVTGGEVSALAAKTTHQSVAKITHVKVTKHKVTGYTTAKSHIKLMKLKHGEKASATANKKGKFTVKVKNNNLTKLKFKIKATKPGLKARTYTHKVKKAVQAIDNSVTTETPASTTPVKPDEGKKPEKPADKEKPHEVPHTQYVYMTTTAQTEFEKAQSRFDSLIGNPKDPDEKTTHNQQNTRAIYLELIKGQIDKAKTETPQKDPTATSSFGAALDSKVNNANNNNAYADAGKKIKNSKNYAQILAAAKRLKNAEEALKALIATNAPKDPVQQGQPQNA